MKTKLGATSARLKLAASFVVAALLGSFAVAGAAQAEYALDTGATFDPTLPFVLDRKDYYAAQFYLDAGRTVTDLAAYVTGGTSNPGDTFTIGLYRGDDLFNGYAALQAFQANYGADGFNGVHNLNLTGLAAGYYWLALEVGGSDRASSLYLPQTAVPGSALATAYAYNDGSGYQPLRFSTFGAQVALAPVPEADTWAMMLVGLGMLGFVARGKTRA